MWMGRCKKSDEERQKNFIVIVAGQFTSWLIVLSNAVIEVTVTVQELFGSLDWYKIIFFFLSHKCIVFVVLLIKYFKCIVPGILTYKA